MLELGPFAETACEGWRTQDLAAHLWIREHRPSALPGIGLPRFAARTARIQQEALHSKGYLRVLEELRTTPWPMRLLDPVAGATEWYIHHEDVLRPAGRKVALSDDEQRRLGKQAMLMAGLSARRKPYRLVVTQTGERPRSFGSGDRIVHVEGAGSELLLHFAGRESDVRIVADDVDAYLEGRAGL